MPVQSRMPSPACNPRLGLTCLFGRDCPEWPGAELGSRWLNVAEGSARSAQIGQHGEDAPVGAGIGVEAEILEDLLDVRLDGALSDNRRRR